jgi:hypothetical protein
MATYFTRFVRVTDEANLTHYYSREMEVLRLQFPSCVVRVGVTIRYPNHVACGHQVGGAAIAAMSAKSRLTSVSCVPTAKVGFAARLVHFASLTLLRVSTSGESSPRGT